MKTREKLWLGLTLMAVVVLGVAMHELVAWLVGSACLMADFSWIGANSQADANKTNTRATNKLNYQMFRQARGEGGSAVLPLYMRMKDGRMLEQGMSEDMSADYQAGHAGIPDYQGVTDQYKPSVDRARATAAGIFDGGVEKQMTDNFAPVKAARVTFKRQSAIDALHKTLGEIDAANAGKGFSGDSSGNQLLKFNAHKQMGDELAGVNMQNLDEERGIKDNALNLKLSNMDLPYRMSKEELAFAQAPHDTYIDSVMKNLQPLSFLRIGGSQPFQYQNMPMQTGPTMMSGLGNSLNNAGGSALNMWLQQRTAQQYADAMSNRSYNWGEPSGGYNAGGYTGQGAVQPTGGNWGTGE